MKPAVRVSRILAGLAIAALLLTAIFARAPGLWDALRGAPLHDLSLTLPGDPGTYRTLRYPEGSLLLDAGTAAEVREILDALPRLKPITLSAPPTAGAITVENAQVVFYPACVSVSGRLYTGTGYSAAYEKLLALCRRAGGS